MAVSPGSLAVEPGAGASMRVNNLRITDWKTNANSIMQRHDQADPGVVSFEVSWAPASPKQVHTFSDPVNRFTTTYHDAMASIHWKGATGAFRFRTTADRPDEVHRQDFANFGTERNGVYF